MGTISCFFQLARFEENGIWIPTVLVFVAGLIKCYERVKALLNASFDSFEETLLPKPDAGPDYVEAVERYRLIGPTAVPVESQSDETTPLRPIRVNEDDNTQVDEIELLRHARHFFNVFKVLFTSSFVSFHNREVTRRYFLRCHYSDAFRLIENELSFLYDLMHTKVSVLLNKFGYLLRFICFSSVLAGFIMFCMDEEQGNFRTIDLQLTYLLFVATISLDIISLSVLFFSDWNLLRRPKIGHFIHQYFLKRKRWSRLVFQYNMFSYFLDKHPTRQLERLARKILHSTELVDRMIVMRFSSSKTVTEDLEEFIFTELKMKSEEASGLTDAKEACSQRRLSALLSGISSSTPSHTTLEWSIKEFEYLESLLLWHMATELCYHNLDQNTSSAERSNKIKFCKLLSDYMFYLLMMHPTMLSPRMGNFSIVFQDTLAEMMRFSHKNEEVCKILVSVDTPYRPATVKGRKSKSLLFDACYLEKKLRDIETDEQWELMSRVWFELMCFAAMNCSPAIHAEQPSRGGELLTFVWLLMYHMGLGTQFSEPIEPPAFINGGH